jgi:hypothetical protein
LIHTVDGVCGGPAAGRRIVEGGIGVDWHEMGSSLIVWLTESVDRGEEVLR